MMLLPADRFPVTSCRFVLSESRRWLLLLVASAWLAVSGTLTATEPADKDYFENHIRPLLVRNCISCHGDSKQEGSLRLITLDDMLQGGDSGPVLVPGAPDESLILEALRHESFEMPPDGKLDDELVEAMSTWIAAGAPWPRGEVLQPLPDITDDDRQWWAIQPMRDPAVPEVENSEWCRNEIDHFILERLEAEGLAPSESAAPRDLYRRVHFAVTGLPPAWRPELEEWAASDPGWYEQLVDQLLEQSSYGENQARYWLDLVRYADSDGYRADGARPAAHLYRDYVIRSFNEDKPYDRFVREQLAGDEIAPDDREAIIGTMYLRHWIYEWNQRDVEGQWQEVLDDVTETTADAFLALGLKCARCHNHKFDPLLQKDFFRLQAFFRPLHPREDVPVASIKERERYWEQWEAWMAATDELRRRLHEIEHPVLLAHATGEGFDKFVDEIKGMIQKLPEDRTPYEQQIATFAERQFDLVPDKLPEWLDEELEAERQRLRSELAALEKQKPEPLPTQEFVVTDVGPMSPATWILGDSEQSPIDPGVPTILDEAPLEIQPPHPALRSTGRRTALAKWITDPENPLTARVIVNRVWEQHFGVGIVENASDFGHLGSPPSHPELLDWLARRFVEDGWSLKKLHRRILTSATYRQTALRPARDWENQVDPENRLLWRMNPRRLAAEEIVDSLLGASGELGGKQKRAIYEPVRRNNMHPVAGLFDFPDRIRSIPKRHRTTTSTQALMLMNNAWARERAEAMRQQLSGLEGTSFVEAAYHRLFGRPPEEAELDVAAEFLDVYTAVTVSSSPLPGPRPEPLLLEAPPSPGERTGAKGTRGGELSSENSRRDDKSNSTAGQATSKQTTSKQASAEQAPAGATPSEDGSQPDESAEGVPNPVEQAKVALLHALMNSNEMLYVD